ncbi:hypothetical protein Ait01nite_012260 [Actinoplanes italicus]|uniref:Uncharacterized protein n=1 Tax=Actinoplanes italicus TaxID=113567 RepID=A0A2T0KGU6_9ACTN|nr:hypothetical protein [Actinoplanes italicus]PRX22662.1 hypothetical protein CLV67_104190 [Actinoplanes italicus]GIE28181.1 hypothetical protein Ait01nite_012260 [Actinoplanes italicus]
MDPRTLTPRERAVLDALLAAADADGLHTQAGLVRVVEGCPCGCPTIGFTEAAGRRMTVAVDATVTGTHDTLFLYTFDGELGGIEYAAIDERPAEFPAPERLEITVPHTRQ